MATYNLNVTASVDLLGSDISGSQSTDFAIANPLPASSYFTFETTRNSDGFYDSSSPKNMAGTYTLGAGLTGVVKSDYIASVVVKPGGGTLTFIPDNYISGSSLNLRGTTSPPAPTGTSFDIDAQAFFTRVTDAGGTLSSTEQEAVNTLVVQMKADGIWTKMKAIYPMVGASAAACAQNLKSSSFTGTFTSGWTFASTGATPNGNNAYMDTGFNPSTQNQNTSSTHITYYQRGNSDAGTSRGKIGASTDETIVDGIGLGFFSTGTKEVGIIAASGGGEYVPSGTSPATQGFFMINTNGNRNAQHWINGSKNGATVLQTGNMPNYSIWIAGFNNPDSAKYYFNKQTAFNSIGDGLTDTEASDFYDAVQAFQTTLGREV